MKRFAHTIFMIACFIFGWFLFDIIGCAKEYSCEGCYEARYNDLITSYRIQITSTSTATFIYPAVKERYHPGHYEYIKTIPVVAGVDSIYQDTINLKDYFDTTYYSKGDTFYVYYEIRSWLPNFTEEVQHDTLIY